MDGNVFPDDCLRILLNRRQQGILLGPDCLSVELLAVLGHFLVFVGRRVSDYDDLVDVFKLAYPSDIVEQDLMCLVTKSSFRLDGGHEGLQVAGILGEI